MSPRPILPVAFALCVALASGSIGRASADTITEIDLCGIDYSDMLDFAAGWVTDDHNNERRIREIRQKALETKDVIQLNCVNETLCAASSYRRVAEQSFLDLQIAVAQDDRPEAERLFLVSFEAWKRIGEFRTAAEQCVGGETFIPPEIQVEVCPGHEPPPDYFPDLPACPVPEPGTLGLLAAGAAATLSRTRRMPPAHAP